MKIFCRALFLVAFCVVGIHGQAKNTNIRSISTGTSFGMCRGYCQQSINITSTPLQIIALKSPNFEQANYPRLRQSFSIPSSQWNEIVSLLDEKKFRLLNDRIGCPDCADGGAEWIAIDGTNGIKRVTFENGRQLDGFETLLERLRQLRGDYITRLLNV